MITNACLNKNASWIHVNGMFSICEFGKYTIPIVGWKVHVSATNENFRDVLLKVSEFYKLNGYIFKYISTLENFHQNLSIHTNPGVSGKLITIYPKDEKMASEILEGVSRVLIREDGPLVMSDFEYRDSCNVFFRYGLNRLPKVNNQKYRMIQGPNGALFEDKVRIFPELPNWIEIPNKWILKSGPSKLVSKYHLTRIVSHSNGGNVYEGMSNNGIKVIVKESRKFIEKFSNCDETYFDENEWKVANQVQNYVEQPVERMAEKHSIYYVYVKSEGISVEEYMGKHSILFAKNAVQLESEFAKLKKIMINVLNIMKYLWTLGFENVDVHARNFLIGKDESVVLIDLETLNLDSYEIKTPAYWFPAMTLDSRHVKDIRRMGLLFVYLFGEENLYTEKMSISQIIELVDIELNPVAFIEGLKELLQELLLKKNPSVDKVSELLKSLDIKASSGLPDLPLKLEEYSREDAVKHFMSVLKLKKERTQLENELITISTCSSQSIDMEIRKQIKK